MTSLEQVVAFPAKPGNENAVGGKFRRPLAFRIAFTGHFRCAQYIFVYRNASILKWSECFASGSDDPLSLLDIRAEQRESDPK
jgi:hypothetical protein